MHSVLVMAEGEACCSTEVYASNQVTCSVSSSRINSWRGQKFYQHTECIRPLTLLRHVHTLMLAIDLEQLDWHMMSEASGFEIGHGIFT